MDWSPLVQAAASLVAATLSVLAVKVWAFLEERIKLSAATRLGAAAERAAGQVLNAIDSADVGVALDDVKRVAMEQATVAMSATMKETLARLGGGPNEAAALIRGEVGKLLAKAPAPAP